MVLFQIKDKSEIFKIPNFRGIPNVYFADYLETENEQVANPIVGAWFRIEKVPEPTPPAYEYDEVGITLEGIESQNFSEGK
ncbi:hypothetical protein N7499_009334 [Penicillium canescens]|uniref:Uncharacterized protein n=1 Tax=Penicillium canescens TaxID=5083 RepID=A0AAD6NET2_PENCN|nr:uncharacterized protein N7446_008640 [Penicillium canescens]KAJ5981615.1 hypothetical protein N7522_013243 [Penicillium canescens]KAJ6033064.1 hypothetical protein N7444_010835 [Penicillium canescens]KAJ6057744.1 hypothetical protein N7460_001018 [Penicillium canescens]KAJ6059057.1 hypothetical protein N7446_008640 [Penicillium canescens]KAJ6071320.1 hypothetical protein N7499_009334 [Penicillium canescens]